MSRDDNIDDLFADEPTPAPDAPPGPDELAQAAAFASLVDDVVSGALPPVMSTDQRSLAEVAGIVQASTRDIALDAARQSQIIDQALGKALASIHGNVVELVERRDDKDGAQPADEDRDPGDRQGVSDLAAFRRKRLRTVIPWAAAAVAAAAALILLLGRPTERIPGPDEVASNRDLPAELQSRPSDELIGEIPREQVEFARERVDRIYADRMAGYRSLRFGGRQ